MTNQMPQRPRRGHPPPPSLCVDRGRVEVLTPDRPGPAVSVTEEEACRCLLAFPAMLAACERLLERIDTWGDIGEGEVRAARAAIAAAKGGHP